MRWGQYATAARVARETGGRRTYLAAPDERTPGPCRKRRSQAGWAVMRVAELVGVRQFRLADQVVPDPGPGELQVRVQAVGICGSDMHSFSEGGIGDTRCRYPMVLGHEPAGVIARTGPGVTGWAAGDLVACEP